MLPEIEADGSGNRVLVVNGAAKVPPVQLFVIVAVIVTGVLAPTVYQLTVIPDVPCPDVTEPAEAGLIVH